MTHLSVVVRLQGRVVEQRLLRLVDGLRLGDAPDAVVAFPGAALQVGRDAWGWTVGLHRLVAGRPLTLVQGDVVVTVEAVEEDPAGGPLDVLPDLRLLVLTAAALLLAATVEAAHETARAPAVAAQLRAWVLSAERPAPSPAAPAPDTPEAWPPPVGLADP